MDNLIEALAVQRRKDIEGTVIMSILYVLVIGYSVFTGSTLGIWAMIGFQLLPTFLCMGPSLETQRWSWWKISWLLTLAHWSLGLSLGFIARTI